MLTADATTDVTKIVRTVFREAGADRRRPGAAVGDVGQGRRAGRFALRARSRSALSAGSRRIGRLGLAAEQNAGGRAGRAAETADRRSTTKRCELPPSPWPAPGISNRWRRQIRREIERRGGSVASRVAAIGAIAEIEGRDVARRCSRRWSRRKTRPRCGPRRSGPSARSICRWRPDWRSNRFAAVGNEAEMSDFLLPIVNRQRGANLLAEALAKVTLGADPAKLAHRALSATGHDEPALIAVLNRALGITDSHARVQPAACRAAGRRGRQPGRCQSRPAGFSVETGQLRGLSQSGRTRGRRRARSVGGRIGLAGLADHRVDSVAQPAGEGRFSGHARHYRPRGKSLPATS